jgi:hydrogenase maturation protein HypF
MIGGRELVLRRARGYAPLPIALKSDQRRFGTGAILGVGAHLKNTVALAVSNNVFVSQHIGDLETKQAYVAFERTAKDLPEVYGAQIDVIACDLHPDYLSTKFATHGNIPAEPVQHHWAHVAACMAENEIAPPLLGVAWDGTGYGLDKTIWGGEFLLARENGWIRVAHLRQFRLPGGDAAAREPRRSALGLSFEIFGTKCWDQLRNTSDITNKERVLLNQMLEKKVNAPLTSSAGRLFDAVASLVQLRQRASFEGQAAMELEFAAQAGIDDSYPFALTDTQPVVVDWEPIFRELLNDVDSRAQLETISAKFHNTLVEIIVAVAKKIGENKIVLTGGCFQNRYLTERTIARLREEKFRPYWHQRIPPNDGGIALGQCVAAGLARSSGRQGPPDQS